MDMGSLIKLGANAFIKSKLSGDTGSNLDISSLGNALSGLTGGDEGSGLDLGNILGKMQEGGMSDIAQSWLGDGENEAISNENVTNLFGEEKISSFASELGLSEDEAVGGLSDVLPQLLDNASSGGSILDSVGGVSGAINIASKLFGR